MRRRRLHLSWSHGPRITYDRYLSPGEEVAFEVRRHAAALLAPVTQAFGAWIAFFLLHNWLDLPSDSNPVDTVMFIVVMAFTLRAIWSWFEWQIERVLVTNKRIVEFSGIIPRRVASMPSISGMRMSIRTTSGRAASDGVMEWLSARSRGPAVGAAPREAVPNVPGGVLGARPRRCRPRCRARSGSGCRH